MDSLMVSARRHTEGKTVVVVGGIPYPGQKRNLERLLGCTIRWRAAERGKRLQRVKASVLEADLVIAAVKLSSHDLVVFALDWRRTTGIPVVLAPAGLNPNRIAHEIVTQLQGP